MNIKFFNELTSCFKSLSQDPDTRVIIIAAELDSKAFSAGLDLKDTSVFPKQVDDPARQAYEFLPLVKLMQDAISSISICNKPVIAAIHGLCIGGAVDLITACDIRLCSNDASFTVKEVDIGLCADIGTLQRLPKVVGNQSWVNEICLTGRFFSAAEAKEFGLVSKVYETRADLHIKALELAKLISSKAPIATLGTKRNLNYSREHTVQEGLDYVALWNSVMINSPDTFMAIQSALSKTKPKFAKL